MPTLDEYLAQRWARLSADTIRILDLNNPEVAKNTMLLWSLQWVDLKETELEANKKA